METNAQIQNSTKQHHMFRQKYSQSLPKKLFRTVKYQMENKSIKHLKKQGLKTEENYNQQFQKEKNMLILTHQGKTGQKLFPSTYRPGLIKTIHNSNEIILVYLLYKQQKISLFLNKGTTFEQLTKKLFKEIYTFQKQSYSNSNLILKNLLYQIPGFQSTDDDILFDYKFKCKRGVLDKQKLFVPFKQQDVRMPFKIFAVISELPYEGHQFLARNFSDGKWSIVKTVKKSCLNEENIVHIKKLLKSNFNACALMIKNSGSMFSQFNWLETKHFLITVTQFFPENLEENLKRNKSKYESYEIKEIFIYFSKWIGWILQKLVNFNIKNYSNMSLKNIVLNSVTGQPMLSVVDKIFHPLDSTQRGKSLNLKGKRNSQKIQDNFYYETYINLLNQMRSFFENHNQNEQFFDNFFNSLTQLSNEGTFTFEIAKKCLQQQDQQKPLNFDKKCPIMVDFHSKILQITQNLQQQKNNEIFTNQHVSLISQLKQEIHEAYDIQNWRKNHLRNQTFTDMKILPTTHQHKDSKNQNISNLAEFKRQEERKSHLKTQEKTYIQQIINETNQNQNFIKTTKQNNLASIGSYLRKSNERLKKQFTEKIENKYKKFLDKNQNRTDEEILKQMRNSYVKKGTFLSKKGCFSQSRSSQNLSFNLQNHKFSSLVKRQPQKILLQKNTDQNKIIEKNESKSNITRQNPSFVERQSFSIDQSFFGGIQRDSLCKTTVNASRSKLFDSYSQLINSKRQNIEDSFVNKRDLKKQDKIMLKKKQYGIYLKQAEKQYNKIKALKKNATLHLLK